MIKRESRYIIRRVIVGVLIALILSFIRGCEVYAAECTSETINKSYYYNSTWTQFTNNPMQFVSEGVDKVSIRFSNNNIQNKSIIKKTHSNVTVLGSHFNDPTITVYLKDGSSQSDISNNCTNTISHSCTYQNDSLCLQTTYSITTNCVFNSTLSSANLIEIQYSSPQGIVRFYNDNNCLQINPTDTQQIIESQNNNGNQITDAINDNGETIDHELESINETISDMFQNMGSCREQPHLILKHNYKLDSSGNEVADNNYGISGYIRVYKDTQINRTTASTDQVYMCFYGNNNQLISCETERQVVGVTIPANTYYVRYTWSQVEDKPRIDMCSKSNDMTQQTLDQMAEDLNKFREDYNNSQQVCSRYDKSTIKTDNYYLNSNGNETSSNYWGITDYINIYNSKITRVENLTSHSGVYMCVYNDNKDKINCFSEYENETITITSQMKYIRFSINKNSNKPQFEICRNSGDALYMTLTDSNIGNTGVAFFDNFNTGNWHGLQSIVSLPLTYVQSLNNTCQPISLPTLQYDSFNFDLTIPCMSSYVYSNFPSELIDLLRLLVNGFIVYYLLKWAFEFVKELRDPDYDELEVMDL